MVGVVGVVGVIGVVRVVGVVVVVVVVFLLCKRMSASQGVQCEHEKKKEETRTVSATITEEKKRKGYHEGHQNRNSDLPSLVVQPPISWRT